MCEHSEFIAASLNNLQILNKQTNNEHIHSRPTAHPENQKTGDHRKILIPHTGQTGESFENSYKEHLLSFKCNKKSKFSQHLLGNVQFFRRKNDVTEVLRFSKKAIQADITEKKIYICKETVKGNQLKDKRTVTPIKYLKQY